MIYKHLSLLLYIQIKYYFFQPSELKHVVAPLGYMFGRLCAAFETI